MSMISLVQSQYHECIPMGKSLLRWESSLILIELNNIEFVNV